MPAHALQYEDGGIPNNFDINIVNNEQSVNTDYYLLVSTSFVTDEPNREVIFTFEVVMTVKIDLHDATFRITDRVFDQISHLSQINNIPTNSNDYFFAYTSATTTWTGVNYQVVNPSQPPISSNSGEAPNYEVDLDPEPSEELAPAVQGIVKSAAVAGKSVSIATFLMNSPSSVTLMKIMQLIEYMVYIDVKLPENLKNFLNLISGSALNIEFNPFAVDEHVNMS